MKRVAIFGGSFNPVHNGHLALAAGVLQAGWADEVWLMVSPQNPLKSEDGLMPEEQRLRLARLAVAGRRGIAASDFEFGLPRPSYTWQTLEALRTAHPQKEFLLLIGSDNWQIFHRWARGEEILKRHGIIVYPRPGFPVSAAVLPPGVRLLEGVPLYPWSSTDIRQRLRQGADVSQAVPPAVAQALGEMFRPEH